MRITRRQLLDPEIAARWPVGWRDALLCRLWLLLNVDVRVHTLQTKQNADKHSLKQILTKEG